MSALSEAAEGTPFSAALSRDAIGDVDLSKAVDGAPFSVAFAGDAVEFISASGTAVDPSTSGSIGADGVFVLVIAVELGTEPDEARKESK